ncbi:pyridoxal phosphate-dependent aminotransferase [Mesobaculum littorinae]|uniref:Aminotransferase n=1 Tax=Mesobaculum littorinae TaxID=2486419 RepID=A0A438AI48_9RHOB|nr:pyridoxal phosphate-dependent aminotransferase [Mesobaculum littorinae]RVV98406.1 pyridoxal phosphate-dependent aminotransferase [Mesobaculum littorinae]
MRLLSATLDRIRPSPTVAVTDRARALKAAGRDVIGLGAGEPDFDTPDHIKAAAIRAIEAGETKYTAVDGMDALKDAVAAKFARENGLDYGRDEISVAAGGKHILFNAMLATLDPGDEVVIPAPYWVSYPDIVRLAGGTPVILPCAMAAGFKLTPEALRAALTPRTKWLVLNSPSNPTGVAYTRDEIAALAEVVRDFPDLHVMSDDIYEHLVYDGFEVATIAAVAPDLRDRVLTCNGVSKAYAMTGWRIGYAGGPAHLIAAMRKLQSQSTTNPSSISQHAALAALEGPQEFLADFRRAFARRRDLVVARLDTVPGITCPRPDGAFYVYPDISGCLGKTSPGGTLIDSDEAFATALLEEAGVAVVFGAAFGLSPHFRVSYATDDETLQRACDRIGDFCAALR